jgi:hypothetical protein
MAAGNARPSSWSCPGGVQLRVRARSGEHLVSYGYCRQADWSSRIGTGKVGGASASTLSGESAFDGMAAMPTRLR